MTPTPAALEIALKHHRAGRLRDAETIYRQILQRKPEQPDAMHLLGVLAHQVGEHQQAIDRIARAIRAKPDEAAFHCDLGIASRALGKLEEAASAYRKALDIRPDFADAHYNLGNVLRQQGRPDEAAASFRHALRIDQSHARAANNLGSLLHEQGDLHQAAALFQKAVELGPNFAEAHYNLGKIFCALGKLDDAVAAFRRAAAANANLFEVQIDLAGVLYQQGKQEDAADALREAIRIRPDSAEANGNLGTVLFELERVEEAATCYRRALGLKPDYADAHNGLGVVLKSRGKLDQAADHFRRAIQVKPWVGAYNNLGLTYHQMGKLDDAVAAYQRAEELQPSDADVQNNLGNTLYALNQVDQAAARYRRALEINPRYAAAENNLGNALRRQGLLDEACQCYQRTLQLDPNHAQARNNLGSIHESQGRREEAESCYRQALEKDPNLVEAHNNLGTSYFHRKQLGEAIACFQRALAIQPDHVKVLDNLSEAFRHEGRTEELAATIQRAEEIEPSLKRRFGLAMLLPVIYGSAEEVSRWRRQMVDRFAAMIADGVQIDPTQDLLPTTFFLAYQGLNDRDLQQMVSRVLLEAKDFPRPRRAAFEEKDFPRPHRATLEEKDSSTPRRAAHFGRWGKARRPGKIRVGFLSRYFKNHTIGKLSRGLIANLSRQLFHVTVLSLGEHDHSDAREIQRQADRYVVVPEDPAEARQTVADTELDVLFYTDVGMDPLTSVLARARLAPVQCVTWGHPVTTGMSTIDYFVSSGLLEPPHAEEHYTEQLVKLKSLPTYFYRPQRSSVPKTRADFGLSDSAHIYLCPQNLFKFHPDFDHILVEILRRDPLGEIVLIDGLYQHWTEMLMERFRSSLPDGVDRVRFLPRQSYPDFLHLLGVSDVVLDPLHFGGGSSTYETLSLGTPIVTLPSGLMRGRVTLACYRKMGMLDCVASSADHYVDLAVRLGTDREHRRRVRAKILASVDTLFEDDQAVRELEQFFLHVVQDTPADANPPLADVLHTSTCPACGHHVAVSFYDGGGRPLATLAWPASCEESQAMPRYALSFVRCVDCGHVYNRDFDYAVVPYCDKPNLMFNLGTIWTNHLEHVRRLILDRLPEQPTVVEIGSGDGSFLRSLAQARPRGRYIGFDPNAAMDASDGLIELRRSLFEPAEHLAECRPDLIVSRHVFEHLMNPLGFVQSLSFAAGWLGIDTRLFIEVPCIDKALAMGRTVDFFYEHNSNFTMTSLERLLKRCASGVELVERGYNDEVTYGIAYFAKRPEQVGFARDALAFRARAVESQAAVCRALEDLIEAGKTLAIWGGTGKAAAFIGQYGLDAERFPIVVDSDPDKAGTFVPGTGQEIRFRDYLLDHPVQIILIGTQWRAADIVLEIERCRIPFEKILLEHQGRLIDYFKDQHPYHQSSDNGGMCTGNVQH